MANSHFWVQLDSYLTIWIYNSVGSIYLVTNYTVLFFRSLFSSSTIHTYTISYCTLKSTRLLLSLSVFFPHSRWIPSIPVTTKQNVTIIIRGTQWRFPLKCIANTFQAIQSTFSSLEMHSKRCYKICICSFVLGRLESFRNYKGLRIIFAKILDAILSFTKVRIFLIPPSIARLDSKILGFLLLRKTGKLGYWNAKN